LKYNKILFYVNFKLFILIYAMQEKILLSDKKKYMMIIHFPGKDVWLSGWFDYSNNAATDIYFP